MSRCDELDREIDAYLDGTLPTVACEALEEHAAACERCGAVLESRTRRRVTVPTELPPPAWVRGAILERIATPVAREPVPRDITGNAGRRAGVWRRWVLPVAATALVMAGLTLLRPASKEAMMREAEMQSVGALAMARARPEFEELARARNELTEAWNAAAASDRPREQVALRRLQAHYTDFLGVASISPDVEPPSPEPVAGSVPVPTPVPLAVRRAPGLLRAWVPAGNVRVRYWALDSISVTTALPGGVALADSTSGGERSLVVQWNAPDRTGLAPADVQLMLPLGTALYLQSGTAAADIVGGTAALTVHTVAGRVRVRSVTGPVTLRSIQGPIDGEGVTGSLRVVSGSGEMRLRRVSGPVHLSSVRGAIYLNTVESDRMTVPDGSVETISGEITVTGLPTRADEASTLGPAGRPEVRLEVFSHDGIVRVRTAGDDSLPAPPAGVNVTTHRSRVNVDRSGGI